jgi:hypothetical protein
VIAALFFFGFCIPEICLKNVPKKLEGHHLCWMMALKIAARSRPHPVELIIRTVELTTSRRTNVRSDIAGDIGEVMPPSAELTF